ncbi:MAG TPA: DUF6401 family natural product biosynthesis protein [Micromonosporaceae bacterium]|nr:DUF6401 family natural product biosynthesis protein [Micromonosporaceae bacterium]
MTALRHARAALAMLMETVGGPGLAAARARPGLLAAVDQHAAEVRDSLLGDLRPLTPVTLAGYAAGVRDLAQERGWTAPGTGWHAPDWVLTRLLAVCWLHLHTEPGPAPAA